jgi:L-iditol 2-dehydrogenase
MATPPIDGALCDYVTWPADFCYHLPDSMTDEEGAMMEPLSVGLWAVERGGVEPADMVAIFGSGPIGLLTLQAAGVAGASSRIAVDIEPFRLQHASRLGATHTFDDRDGDALERIIDLAAERSGFAPDHAGVDVAFETAGAVPTTRNALAAVRPGGVAVLVGLPPESMVEIDLVSAASKEIDIRGMFRYANRYPVGIALTAAGRVEVASLVTHHFALEEVEQALRFADENKSEALKIMIDIGD